MAASAPVSVVRDPAVCRTLWHSGPTLAYMPFRDWDIRCELAAFDGMQLHFIVHQETGTTLPLGEKNGKLFFFGGMRYAERNGFVGGTGGEHAIFEFLRDGPKPIRLLSWVHDPAPFLPAQCRHWDVPFNQFWTVDKATTFADHVVNLAPGHSQEFQYLERKFKPRVVTEGFAELVDRFLEPTIEAFAKRNHTCAYADTTFMARARLFIAALERMGLLRAMVASYGGEDLGVVLFTEDAAAKESVYLLVLYKPAPSKVSNCLVLAMTKHCLDLGLTLDGMRGAFTLKPRYGLKPRPSFAVVNDPSWTIEPQTDMPPHELLALYGRPFGSSDA